MQEQKLSLSVLKYSIWYNKTFYDLTKKVCFTTVKENPEFVKNGIYSSYYRPYRHRFGASGPLNMTSTKVHLNPHLLNT